MVRRSLGLAIFGVSVLGCTTSAPKEESTSQASSALGEVASTTRTFRWGDGETQLGFKKAVTERLAMGAPAIAVGPTGQVFVLDALHERVVRLDRTEVNFVAKVPRDADDIAVGSDGTIAVRRSMKPEVLVIGPGGTGSVDVSGVEDIDAIALGKSHRVVVTNAFQETFQFGSPHAPQLPAFVRETKREGAVLLADGSGVVAVRSKEGELEIRVVAQANDKEEKPRVVARHSLGKGSAARIVGTNGRIVCARIEHVAQDAQNVLVVDREAACLDSKTGQTMFRTKLPAAGAYVPRRELTFSGSTLAFAQPTDDGLSVTTWKIEGGAR